MVMLSMFSIDLLSFLLFLMEHSPIIDYTLQQRWKVDWNFSSQQDVFMHTKLDIWNLFDQPDQFTHTFNKMACVSKIKKRVTRIQLYCCIYVTITKEFIVFEMEFFFFHYK